MAEIPTTKFGAGVFPDPVDGFDVRANNKKESRMTETTDLPFRLRAAVIKWCKGVPVFGRQRRDIIERLRSDAIGPSIHPGYYRQDLIDAADEIERLRALVNGVKDPNYV